MLKEAIVALINERYKDAEAVFWGGSLVLGKGTKTSDVDLVVIYKDLPNAYREAFIHEGIPYDVFIHSVPTLRYFFKEMEAPSGKPALMNMILNGHEITLPSLISEEVKNLAHKYYDKGPSKWDKKTLEKERFFITDVLDDIIAPNSKHEQMAACGWLYEALGQFYLRANNLWSGSGKALARRIEEENSDLAREFAHSFSVVFQSGDTALLEKLVEKILEPFEGKFWDGYKEEFSKEWRAEEIVLEPDIILTEPNSKEVHDKILSGLRAYNKSKVGEYTRIEFNIYMKSPEDTIIGGIDGDQFGDTLRIFLLWVDEKHRSYGIGKKLMKALEKYAMSKECKTIQLNTAEFQARGFYEKLGFEVVATLDKSFLYHDLYVMRKVLIN